MTQEARREALLQTIRIAGRTPQAYIGLIHLKERCVHAGISQRELSRKLGISFNTINSWCRLSCSPPAIQLPAIAEALGCTIAELFLPPDEDGIDETNAEEDE